MSNDPNETTEGTYDPTGGIPGHPAAPGFGDKDKDDAVDADDDDTQESTPAAPEHATGYTTPATEDTEPA